MKSQDSRSDWSNFYCGVHPLDSFAKVSDKCLRNHEKESGVSDGKSFTHRSGSRTQALIFAVAKMFHKDGSGVPAEISAYLCTKGIRKNLIHYFVGERFHILFHNAGAVYYLRSFIIDFLQRVWGTPNSLLSAILSDLQVPVLLECLRALGLVGKVITGPWLKYTMAERPVWELSPFYTSVVQNLKAWCTDATPLLSDAVCIYDGCEVEKDAIWQSLVQPNSNDGKVKAILQNICSCLLTVCERQLVDHLPGGVHHHFTESMKVKAASCTSNNISGERVFAHLDASIRRAPNGAMDFHESKILFGTNGVQGWLDDLEEQDRAEVIATARKLGPVNMISAREKAKLLREMKSNQLRKKQLYLSEKENRNRTINENLLSSVVKMGGLWLTPTQVETELNKLPRETQKKTALKTQLKARKNFLCQKHEDVSIFCFTKNKKQLSITQLRQNLLKLIDIPVDTEAIQIDKCIKDPSILEDKFISHKWCDVEEDNGFVTDKWYDGQIGKIVNQDDVVEYQIDYFETKERIFMEIDEVLTDLKNGDLIVLW
jgi:hypothetical protein